MDELEKLKDCNDVKKFVNELIKAKNFEQEFEHYNILHETYKGFIPLNYQISYNGQFIYNLDEISYLYEAFDYIKRLNTTDKYVIIMELETFLILYFGISKNDRRDEFFRKKWLDEFKKIKTKNETFYFQLSELKKERVAQCTEFSVTINQILNLIGIETYMCYGYVSTQKKNEGHAFNIIKYKDKIYLIDYSITCLEVIKRSSNSSGFCEMIGANDYYDYELPSNCKYTIPRPFITQIGNKDIDEFLNNEKQLVFKDYNISFNHDRTYDIIYLNSNRTYTINKTYIKER